MDVRCLQSQKPPQVQLHGVILQKNTHIEDKSTLKQYSHYCFITSRLLQYYSLALLHYHKLLITLLHCYIALRTWIIALSHHYSIIYNVLHYWHVLSHHKSQHHLASQPGPQRFARPGPVRSQAASKFVAGFPLPMPKQSMPGFDELRNVKQKTAQKEKRLKLPRGQQTRTKNQEQIHVVLH